MTARERCQNSERMETNAAHCFVTPLTTLSRRSKEEEEEEEGIYCV